MILITGCAGFIGFNLAKRLCGEKFKVIGIDKISQKNISQIKKDRLKILKKDSFFKFQNIDISDYTAVSKFFKNNKIKFVIHLAALPGVRESMKNPQKFFSSNITGFFNIIESSNKTNVMKFIYASSSSVYDSKAKIPYKETDSTKNQISFYAFSKKNSEQIAEYYSKNHNLITIGLRFFSVYGPWGRPDMAYYKFTDMVYNNKPIDVFNHGNHKRDFTYIDDVTDFIKILINKKQDVKKKFSIFNVGYGKPINLGYLIKQIEKNLGKKAKIKYLEKQLGDVHTTFADTKKSKRDLKYKARYPFDIGIKKFVDWYIKFHKTSYKN
jgi:UDP-glucuronate 4-epimerase